MELAAFVTAFLTSWNDALPTDEDRDRLCKPLIPVIVGTATGSADDQTRAWMATDWLCRVHTPAWLRLAGLDSHADGLASLPPVTAATVESTEPALDAARSAAWAAAKAGDRDAPWAASGSAARAASGSALEASAMQLVSDMAAVGRP
jgi:hypothetical protein